MTMGTIIHRAVIAEMPVWPPERRGETMSKLERWRASLPEEWRALVVGPVKAIVNHFEWVLFLPDGSKEGWDISGEGDKRRAEFLEIFPGALHSRVGRHRHEPDSRQRGGVMGKPGTAAAASRRPAKPPRRRRRNRRRLLLRPCAAETLGRACGVA